MNFKSLVFASVCLFLSLSVSGQKNDTIPWNGKQLIEHGIALYDKGNYVESLTLFKRVSKCDPEYAKACYESAMAYENTKEYTLGLQMVNEADSLEPNNVGTITLKGSLLDDLNRQQEAIVLLENARKRWPYNQNLLYNLAIVYVNVLEYNKAEQILTECVKLNPYHAGTHFLLGRINHSMGRIAQSALAYNMGLIMNPSSSNVTKFERTITRQAEPNPAAYLYPYDAGYDATHWKELARFCNSGIAFRKDFPYNATANFLINRASLMLFRLMEFKDSDPTIYNQFYVRFFKEILNRNEVNTLFGFQMQNIGNKEINDWNKANEVKKNKFIKFAQTSINEWREYDFSIENEKKKVKIRLFNEEGKNDFIGTQLVSAEPSKEGNYIGIDNTGFVNEKGTYKNNLAEGLSTIYWSNGNVKQELNFVAGELDGINKTYYENAKLLGIYPRVKGKSEGTEIQYTMSGRVFRKQNFENGLAEGKNYNFYSISGWSLESNYSKGKPHGPYVEKWINGVIKSEGTYVDSLLSGTYKKWYSNGKPESVNESKNDAFVGPFTLYHSNGVKKSEGTYNDSTEYQGNYTEYTRTGKVSMTQTGYINGKMTGVHTNYFDNGNKKDEYVYENDCIKKVTCYDTTGKEHYKAETQNGLLAFKYFYDEGSLRREGNFLNGKKEGEWRDISGGGVILEIENWKEDMQSGVQKTFYPSGNIKTEFYCDSNNIEGPYREFFPNGKLKSLAYYHKGKATGVIKSYYSTGALSNEYYMTDSEIAGRNFDYTPEGTLQFVSEYDEDNELAKQAVYFNGKFQKLVNYNTDSTLVELNYSNGKPQYRYTIVDGLKEGVLESFYPNGKIFQQQFYLRGKIHGPSKQWDIDGNLSSVFTYNLNKIEGYTYVYRNGKVSTRDYYEEGVEQQDYREYYPNGSVFRMIPYVDDKREGEYIFFSPDSVKLFSFNCESNSVISVNIRNKQGKIEKIPASNPTGTALTSYYPNGTIAAIIPLTKGYLDGTLTLYYANGNKLRERTYKNDYLEGLATDYYANGKVKESIRFVNNDKTGEYVSYSEAGLKMEEGELLTDNKTGTWTYYDAAGKPKYKVSYENDRVYEIK